jgi:hypothetical protein
VPLLSRLVSLWRNLRRRKDVEADLDLEIRTYLESLIEARLAQARRQAAIELGGLEQVT